MAATQSDGRWWGCLQGSLASEKLADTSEKLDTTSTRGASSTSQSATSWASSKAPMVEPEPSLVGHGGLGLCEEASLQQTLLAVQAPAAEELLAEPCPASAGAKGADEVEERLGDASPSAADMAAAVAPTLATVLPPPGSPPSQLDRCHGWTTEGTPALGPGEDATIVAASEPEPPAVVVPPLHCSEIIQAVIGKQHEMERFMVVPVEGIPHSTMTKMSMLKSELDLLSASISGVLNRAAMCAVPGVGPPGTAAPPVGGWAVPAVAYQAVGQPAQIWPPGATAMSSAYPAEVPYPAEVAYYPMEVAYDAEGELPPEYLYPGNVPEAAPPRVENQPAPYEEHGGPAIFQGFQPPPSYAWSRVAPPAEEEPPAPKPSASSEKTPEPTLVPRPKVIATSSPPREKPSEQPGVKLVLAAALDKLRRCQSSCAQLRAEKRGVPTHEVEGWCASLAEQLKVLVERLEQKLEVYRQRSRAKDETIRRLYRRLQAAEQASNGHRTATPVRSPLHAEGMSEPSHRGLASGWSSASQQPLPQSWTSGFAGGGLRDQGASSLGDLSEPGLEPAYSQVVATVGCELTMSPQASPSSSATRASSSMHHIMPEDPSRMPASARANAGRRTAAEPSQKCLQRPAERTQQVHMRREGAHLRRRDADLAGQVRARDQQIEQLTNTMRELQLVTQRQIGLYKRQLHLKDNELQAKQEELNQRECIAASATALGGAADGGRGGRRHGPQASAVAPSASMLGLVSPQGPSLVAERRMHRGGVTPRPAECERGRNPHASTSAVWVGTTKKEARDRSLGAMPQSPRAKARGSVDAAAPGHAEGALRRRTSPTISAVGRSTSADERAAARRRQEAEAAAAAAVGKGHSQRYRDGPMTARQRR